MGGMKRPDDAVYICKGDGKALQIWKSYMHERNGSKKRGAEVGFHLDLRQTC